MKPIDLDFCYRELLIVLRHSAPLHGLSIDEDGFVSVKELLELRRFLRLEFKDLRGIVTMHKDELELVNGTSVSGSRSGWAIRARDAHTIAHINPVSLTELSIAELQSDALVYRTTTSNLRRIRAAGEIHRRHQRYITLQTHSSGRNDVARCALLLLDVERAFNADFKFFRDGFGNVVTPGDCNGALPLNIFNPAVEIIKGRKTRRRKSSSVNNPPSREVAVSPAEWYHRPQQWVRRFAVQPDVQLQCISGAIYAASHCNAPAEERPQQLEDSPVAPNRFLVDLTPESSGSLLYQEDLPEDIVDALTDDSSSFPGSDLTDDVEIITSPPSSLVGWTLQQSADVQPVVLTRHRLEKMPVSEPTIPKLSSDTPPRFSSWNYSETVPIPKLLEACAPSQPVPTHTEQSWLILPTSIPGCGKTGLCVALAHLFDFKHLPSGNSEAAVHSKPGQRRFVESLVRSMQRHRVVLVDRNNHLRRHRDEIKRACSMMDSQSTPVKTIALRWPIRSPTLQATQAICTKRILSWRHGQEWFIPRTGDSLTSVLSKFLREAETVCEEEVDVIIEMNVCNSLEQALVRVVSALVPLLGLDTPTEERMREAMEAARSYRTHN